MKVIGLTGQSGAGKGMISEYFAKKDFPHIDCDKVYHSLLIPNSDCTKELSMRFGCDILTEDGAVDRKKLVEIVFGENSKNNLTDLNSITHKYVLDECRGLIKRYRDAGEKAVIVDAPTLFESGFDKECDIIIAVTAPEKSRLARIMARDDISAEKAMARIKSQPSEDFYTRRADYIIENSSDIKALSSQLEKFILEKLN